MSTTTKPWRLKQRFGQNLLIDQNIARKIVSAIYWEWGESVIEIGPGTGALTGLILPQADRLTAVEIDSQFVEFLRKKFGENQKFNLINGDILDMNWQKLAGEERRSQLVGNLPYNITSPVIFTLIQNRRWLTAATLTVQKEVADRLIAPAGIKARGILSVLCQYYAQVHRLFNVSRNCFRPIPKVDSTVIQMIFYPEPPVCARNEKKFHDIIRTAFGQRRKKMSNSLAKFLTIAPTELINSAILERRPEELTVEEFVNLSNDLSGD